jgi:hypothetical protein
MESAHRERWFYHGTEIGWAGLCSYLQPPLPSRFVNGRPTFAVFHVHVSTPCHKNLCHILHTNQRNKLITSEV